MTTQTAEQTPTNNHLTALAELGNIIIAVSQPWVTLYQQQSLAIKPEVFIKFYCKCLEFILQHKVSGSKEHLQQLISNTIEQNVERGSQLYQLISTSPDNIDKHIDKFTEEQGPIIVPVLKLSQFISDAIKQTATNDRVLTENENAQLEVLLNIPLQQAFEIIFQASLQKNQALQIENPLIFLLEHFSIIIGWLIGFFMNLSNKPANEFLTESIACLG